MRFSIPNKIRANQLVVFILPIAFIFFSLSREYIKVSTVEIIIVFSFCIIAVFYKEQLKIITNIHLYLILLFIFSIVGSFVNRIDLSDYSLLIRMLEYIIIFFITYITFTPDSVVWMTRSIKVIIVLLLLFGMVQLFIPDFINIARWGPSWKHYYVEYNQVRVYSLMDNPLYLAALCVIFLPLTKGLNTRFYILSCAILILFSASKSGILLLILFFLFWSRRFTMRQYLAGFTLLLLSITLLVIFYDKIYLFERLVDKTDLNMSVPQRLYANISSIKMIFANPIFGIGNGRFGEVYLSGFIHPNASLDSNTFTSENFILDYYLDFGLIPVIIMVYLLIIPIIRTSKNMPPIMFKLRVTFILFILAGFFTNLRASTINLFLFYFLAIWYKSFNSHQIKQPENGEYNYS